MPWSNPNVIASACNENSLKALLIIGSLKQRANSPAEPDQGLASGRPNFAAI
jgi:hypothetical protein